MRLFHSWICLFTLCLNAGCGNTREDPAALEDGGDTTVDAGNTTVDAGNTTVDGRASDQGPVAPPGQASLFFVVGPPGVPGPGCAISGQYVANIGGPPRSSIGDPGTREIDGVDGARIGCRVSGSSSFDVTGSAEKLATSFVVLDAVVSGGVGTATISVAGPGTAGKQLRSSNDMPCDLFVNRPPYQVAPGAIWAEFDCPLVNNPTSPGSNCSARGEFVFENCEQ
jgi:hypothetical protein